MCGIFGVSFDVNSAAVDRQKMIESLALMRHRGPDAQQILEKPGLGLAHARLSLVDQSSRSNQPFCDDSGRYALVYNGEVYNFQELRLNLERKGVKFHTTSDTEVVLQSLIRHGTGALETFDGMFALAFVDLVDGSVLLARDRFGKKPLFWGRMADGKGGLIFSSTTQAMAPWIDMKPDMQSVYAYLMKFGGPTSQKSFIANINSLAPGAFLEFRRGVEPVVTKYSRLTDFLDQGEAERLAGLSPVQVADEFDEIMQQSIASRRFADANVGAFCSGGVDSSLVLAMAAKENRDISLFHANVKGTWSETKAAQSLADHLKLDLNVVEVEEQDFVDMIPRVMGHYGYPFSYHPNCAPLMLTAQLARDSGVKGLLSGEGADELFLGYPWLGRKPITDVIDGARNGLGRLVRSVPGIGPVLLPEASNNPGLVRDILNGREMSDDMDEVARALDNYPPHARDASHQWTLDYMHHHLRTLLHRNDTMGMAASIEARFPFLEHGLVKFGVNLPKRHKLRVSPFVMEKAHPFVRDKWVVRAVADRYLPKHLSQRIKIGFWTTVFQRLDISRNYFVNSPLMDVLGLSQSQLNATLDGSNSDFQLRMLLSDVWLRTAIDGEKQERAKTRLRDYVTIIPDGVKPQKSKVAKGQRSGASAPI